MAIDTQIPPWLQRNWQPGDHSADNLAPWLKMGFEMGLQRQKLPLEIQQMQLQQQATQAAIEHQGMVNETAGMQLQQYRNELPRFKALLDETKGDPVALMNRVEAFSSPVLQKQFLDAQNAASRTLAGLAATERQKQNWIAYRELVTKSPVAPRIGPDGNVDEASLQESSRALREHEETQMQTKYGWHYDEFGNPVINDKTAIEAQRIADLRTRLDQSKAITDKASEMSPEIDSELQKQRRIQYELEALQKNTSITPQVQLIEGKKFLVNPKTGAVHEISKSISKREFINQHIGNWMRDNPGMTPDQAASAMGQFYDQYISESAAAPSSTAPPPKEGAQQIGGFTVRRVK